MSETSPEEISCQNCVAACCRAGAALVLSRDEVYRNKRKMALHRLYKEQKYPQSVPIPMETFSSTGVRQKEIVSMPIPADYGLYILLEDCGNLTEDGRCAVYEDRPRACRDYEVGATACQDARAAFGLDGHDAQQAIGQPVKVQITRSSRI